MGHIDFDPARPRRGEARSRMAELAVIAVALVGAWLLSFEALGRAFG